MNYQKRYTIGKMLRKKNNVYQKDDKAIDVNFPLEYKNQYQEKGLVFADVTLAQFQLKNGLPYRGLKAKKFIKANSILMSIPRELIISTKTAYFSELNKIFNKHPNIFIYHDEWEEHILMAFLIKEKRKTKSSKYYLFIQQLPTDIDMLIFWSYHNLCLLQDDNLLRKVENQRLEYLKIYEIFKNLFTVDENEFRWAYTNLYTRDFGSGLKYKCLIPFCEYFNHECVDVHIILNPKDKHEVEFKQNKYDQEELESIKSSSGSDESFDLDSSINDLDDCITDQFMDWLPLNIYNQTKQLIGEQIQFEVQTLLGHQQIKQQQQQQQQQQIRDWEDDNFEHFMIKCQTTEQFQKNAQVYFNYGRLSNRELLFRYGIALENNKYDHIYLQINPEDYLNSNCFYFKKQFLSIKLKYTEFPISLIKFCKAINEKNNHSVQWDIDSVLLQTNPEKEVQGLKLAQIMLENFRKQFKENLFESEKLLQNKELSYQEYFALIYRLEKQRIIQHNIKLIKLAIIIVQNREQEKYTQQFETHHEFQTNRIILSKYLSQIKQK